MKIGPYLPASVEVPAEAVRNHARTRPSRLLTFVVCAATGDRRAFPSANRVQGNYLPARRRIDPPHAIQLPYIFAGCLHIRGSCIPMGWSRRGRGRANCNSTATFGRSLRRIASIATAGMPTNAKPVCGSTIATWRPRPSNRATSRSCRAILGKSELVARIYSDDADEQMPPPKSNRRLTAPQKETLKRWIAEGAKYEKSIGLTRRRFGRNCRRSRTQNGREIPIDRFVLAKLEENGLEPSPEADRATLIRRLVARSHRPAADAGRSRCLRSRHRAGCLRKAGRSADEFRALRRAHGAAVARRGPLRRQQRLSAGWRHVSNGFGAIGSCGR